MKIYHNPRCSKSRQTLQLIQDAGIEPTIVEYLIEPLTSKDLKSLISQLNIPPAKLVRTKESLFKELKVDLKSMSESEVIQLLVDNPKLIERPIVVSAGKAIIGRPPENVHQLLDS